MFLNNHLKNKINKAEIVSFDIFDTLLVRPYARPIDLFYHMEKVFNKPNFLCCRVDAEIRTRKHHKELQDITFDMIYDEIEDEFRDMKQKEMDWEELILRANPEIKQVYDYARDMGKKVIIASDMYLPTDFIAKLLRKNGYDGWDALYISGEMNASKHSGLLFSKILDIHNVSPNKILHIGDNGRSDYKNPKKLGIKAEKYQTLLHQFKHSQKRYKNIKTQSFGSSVLMGVMSYKWALDQVSGATFDNYWVKLGYEYAGPVGYAYTRYVEQVAKTNQIEALLFVARDGYLLQKIFDGFSANIKNSYVYAPRFLNHICRLDYVKNNKTQAQAIIDFSKKTYPENKQLSQPFENPCDFVNRNKDIFTPLANKQMQIYRDYLLKHIPVAKKYALVDTITGEFSSQKILQGALQKDLLGIYWGICEDLHIHKYNFESFVGVHTPSDIMPVHKFFTRNWNLIEFLITSPEYPILNIDKNGKPIHSENESPYEVKRASLYPFIEQGALEFTSFLHDWFGNYDIYLSNRDVIDWVNAYIEYPTKIDIENMMDIHFGEDSQHKHWIPLFIKRISFMDFIKHPKRAVSTIRSSVWRNTAQSWMVCIWKPLSIHIRGLKSIEIALFPGLIKRYFTILIGNEKYCRFKFVIGNIKDNL